MRTISFCPLAPARSSAAAASDAPIAVFALLMETISATALLAAARSSGLSGRRRLVSQLSGLVSPKTLRANGVPSGSIVCVSHDTEFEKWANQIWNFGSGLGAEVSLKDFRKDLIIEVYNEAGQLALAYSVYRCWVSEFQALPDLDANANAIAIQTIKLENEGWERDYSVAEPAEPSFTEPAA